MQPGYVFTIREEVSWGSTQIAAHIEGPARFVMCNMCVMMTEI